MAIGRRDDSACDSCRVQDQTSPFALIDAMTSRRTGTTVLREVQRQSATHRVRYQILPLSKYRSHTRPMTDRQGSKKFYSNGSENSRFQVFRTYIFRKLTLGAPGWYLSRKHFAYEFTGVTIFQKVITCERFISCPSQQSCVFAQEN